MNPFLRLLLCMYAFIKHLFGCTADFQQKNDLKTIALRILVITVTLLVYSLLGCIVLPLFIVHHLVDIYLRIKLGQAYGGMLKGQDAAMSALKDQLRVRLVLILNQNEDQPDMWTPCLDVVRKFNSTSYKLSSHIKSCLGFSYFLKDQTKLEDVVEEIRIGNGDHITKEQFADYISNVLPTKPHEKRLCSFQYCPQPINWNNNNKTNKQYACIVSVDHCLGDGPSMMKYAMENLIDSPSFVPLHSDMAALLTNLRNTHKVSLDDACINMNPMYKSSEGFPIVNKNPDRDAYTAIYAEDTARYMNLIKKVKGKIGVGFNAVVMGALSSSLTDYLKKKNKPPMDISLVNLIRPEGINLVFESTGEPLSNDMGFQVILVPAKLANLGTSERLHAINESLKQGRRSLEATMVYTLSKIGHVLPPMLRRLAIWGTSGNRTSFVSNMSGHADLSFAGHSVEAIFFFSPNLPPAFFFGIISLDGRLQMTLHARGEYLSNRKDLQEILDGTLRYFDKYAKEVQIE